MTEIKVKALSKKEEEVETEEWVLTRQYSRVQVKQQFNKKLEKDANNFVKRIDKMVEKKLKILSRSDRKQLLNILDYKNVPHKLLVEYEDKEKTDEDEDEDKENKDPKS